MHDLLQDEALLTQTGLILQATMQRSNSQCKTRYMEPCLFSFYDGKIHHHAAAYYYNISSAIKQTLFKIR